MLADRLSSRWPARVRHILSWVTLLVALVSLMIYTLDLIRPRQAQAAFFYVAVPPASVLAGALVVGAAAVFSRRGAGSIGLS